MSFGACIMNLVSSRGLEWEPQEPACILSLSRHGGRLALWSPRLLHPLAARPAHFDGAKAFEYARQFVAIGPRWPTGPGHVKAEEFLRTHFQRARPA